MANVHYAMVIHAPQEKVWETVLDDASYRQWGNVFMPGSYFTGNWEKGSEMLFLAPDKDGKTSGMRARVVDNELYKMISLEHLAMVQADGSEEVFNTPGGSFENYTFIEKDGGIEMAVDLVNIPDSWVEMMGDMWPQALKKIKELAEK